MKFLIVAVSVLATAIAFPEASDKTSEVKILPDVKLVPTLYTIDSLPELTRYARGAPIYPVVPIYKNSDKSVVYITNVYPNARPGGPGGPGYGPAYGYGGGDGGAVGFGSSGNGAVGFGSAGGNQAGSGGGLLGGLLTTLLGGGGLGLGLGLGLSLG